MNRTRYHRHGILLGVSLLASACATAPTGPTELADAPVKLDDRLPGVGTLVYSFPDGEKQVCFIDNTAGATVTPDGRKAKYVSKVDGSVSFTIESAAGALDALVKDGQVIVRDGGKSGKLPGDQAGAVIARLEEAKKACTDRIGIAYIVNEKLKGVGAALRPGSIITLKDASGKSFQLEARPI